MMQPCIFILVNLHFMWLCNAWWGKVSISRVKKKNRQQTLITAQLLRLAGKYPNAYLPFAIVIEEELWLSCTFSIKNPMVGDLKNLCQRPWSAT